MFIRTIFVHDSHFQITGLTMSPVRLKRYEGFEQGLNTIPAAKGMPYK